MASGHKSTGLSQKIQGVAWRERVECVGWRRLPALRRRFVDLVKAGNQTVEMVVYPNAGHAFHADDRPSYRPAAAAAAWERCLQFFARHLRA